jgi:hypothetical protein
MCKLRTLTHTCFFCRSYPLLLGVTGRAISREPHWIAPERNEQRQASADISVARRLGGERRRCKGIAPLRRKELVWGCDLLCAPPLPLVDRSADYAQRKGAAAGHLRARSRRVRSSGREGERLGSRQFAGRGRSHRQLADLRQMPLRSAARWRRGGHVAAMRADALQQRRDRLSPELRCDALPRGSHMVAINATRG